MTGSISLMGNKPRNEPEYPRILIRKMHNGKLSQASKVQPRGVEKVGKKKIGNRSNRLIRMEVLPLFQPQPVVMKAHVSRVLDSLHDAPLGFAHHHLAGPETNTNNHFHYLIDHSLLNSQSSVLPCSHPPATGPSSVIYSGACGCTAMLHKYHRLIDM